MTLPPVIGLTHCPDCGGRMVRTGRWLPVKSAQAIMGRAVTPGEIWPEGVFVDHWALQHGGG